MYKGINWFRTESGTGSCEHDEFLGITKGGEFAQPSEYMLPKKDAAPWSNLYCHVLVTRHRLWVDNWIY
jgi:hypothetical protein